jgi:NAD(P)-dependent dehydrogenase (short-subunit alcohol dehydrogenase family)
MTAGLIIVTGGARGIGAATCLRLASEGYAIAVNYAADATAAEATVAAISERGGWAKAYRADVADPDAVAKMFDEATAALGPLRGVVNNAGISGLVARIDAQDAASLTRLFEVNVIGTMLCSKEAVRRLSTAQGGSGGGIVNISSVASRLGGLSGLVAYAATKGAIDTFTRGLALEVAREGVRVNAVAPGMTETDMTVPILASPEARERITGVIPMGRVGLPDEIAEAVAWLISPAAAYVTGTIVTVSGGR